MSLWRGPFGVRWQASGETPPDPGISGEITVTADYTPDESETAYRVDVYDEDDALVYHLDATTAAYANGVISIVIPAGALAAGDYLAFIVAVSATGETPAAAGAPFTVTA